MKRPLVITLLHALASGMHLVYSVFGIESEPELLMPTLTKDPSKMKDVDYCVEQLALTLNQAIQYADQYYIQVYEKLKAEGRAVPLAEWRRRPAEVWCQADATFEGYVNCSLEVLDFDGCQHSAQIARFFVISEANKKIEGGFHRTHYDQLVQALKLYQVGKVEIPECQCYRDIFDSRPFSLQVISPYHPKKSRLSFLIRRSEVTNPETFHAVLVPTIKVSRAADTIDLFESLIKRSPLVFNRIVMDPLEVYPRSCLESKALPVVPPKPSVQPRDNLEGHVIDTQAALKEFYGYSYGRREWGYSHHYSNRSPMSGALCSEVISILSALQTNVKTAELLDCSHPLPVMTGSTQCPRTQAVIGSSMFNRVIFTPGLWIALRGQNCMESRTNSLKYLPLAMTTNDFYSFDITDNEELSYHKFHIHKGSKGIFIIIVWEESAELISATVPQLPYIESQIDYFSNSLLAFQDPRHQLSPNIYPYLEAEHMDEQERIRRHRREMRKLSDSSFPRPSAPPTSPTQSTSALPANQSVEQSVEKAAAENQFTEDDFFELVSLEVPSHPVRVASSNPNKRAGRQPEGSLI